MKLPLTPEEALTKTRALVDMVSRPRISYTLFAPYQQAEYRWDGTGWAIFYEPSARWIRVTTEAVVKDYVRYL